MIEVQDLTKRYGAVEAVKGVSFSVGREEILGFLGPNGAGKTTIMKILTGFHFPSAGAALIDGLSVEDDSVEVKRRIGYLPENVPLYGELTVREYLDFIAGARRITGPERKRAVDAGLEACGLTAAGSKRIETLSRGYRQRTGLAQAILHDPPILILDEPTSGLDPKQIIEIRSLIKALGRRKTVILSTHILQEAEAAADRVLILNEGRIAAQGTSEAIAAAMKGGDTWELILKGAGPEKPGPDEIGRRLARLGDLKNVSAADSANGTLRVSFLVSDTAGDSGERIFDWAVAEGLKILSMNRKKPSLEDIFVKLTSGPQTLQPSGGKGGGGE
jgi:ABC-2 type transport system ATP-binding protein